MVEMTVTEGYLEGRGSKQDELGRDPKRGSCAKKKLKGEIWKCANLEC
jgi:hypothetical protein